MNSETVLSLVPICVHGCSDGCGLSGFQGQSTVYDLCQLCARSRLSTVLRKTAFKLVLIRQKYS